MPTRGVKSPSDRPSEATRARLLAAAAREPATRPGTWRRRTVASIGLAAGWLILMMLSLGMRPDWHELPMNSLAATIAVLGAVAAVASIAALVRGRAMGGATTELLSAVVLGAPIVLLGLVWVLDPRGPSTVLPAPGSETWARSLSCDLLIVLMGIPLIGLGLAVPRGLILARPSLIGACLGLGAATFAHVVLRLHCPVGGVVHALGGHLLPAIPLMALGAWGMWILDRRARKPRQ